MSVSRNAFQLARVSLLMLLLAGCGRGGDDEPDVRSDAPPTVPGAPLGAIPRAQATALAAELRAVVGIQETHYAQHGTYARSLAELDVRPPARVSIEVRESTPRGWSAVARDAAAGERCAIFVGAAAAVPPATQPGVIACEREGG